MALYRAGKTSSFFCWLNKVNNLRSMRICKSRSHHFDHNQHRRIIRHQSHNHRSKSEHIFSSLHQDSTQQQRILGSPIGSAYIQTNNKMGMIQGQTLQRRMAPNVRILKGIDYFAKQEPRINCKPIQSSMHSTLTYKHISSHLVLYFEINGSLSNFIMRSKFHKLHGNLDRRFYYHSSIRLLDIDGSNKHIDEKST